MATVAPSQESKRIHYEILSAMSRGESKVELSRMREELDKSTIADGNREAIRLNNISQFGTDVPPTASASTNNNPTQNPSPDGTQKPMFGPEPPNP